MLLLEGDGTRTKISTHKRVKTPRRIVATKRDGLLVDPVDVTAGKPPKVPVDAVAAAIAADPGLSVRALGLALDVTPTTAGRYAGVAQRSRGLPGRACETAVDSKLYPSKSRESTVDTHLSTVQSVSTVRNGRSVDGVWRGPREGPSSRPPTL